MRNALIVSTVLLIGMLLTGCSAHGQKARAADSMLELRPVIVQGAMEGSNVPPVLEVTRMMNELREFQFTTQLIQAEDDRLRSVTDKLLSRNG